MSTAVPEVQPVVTFFAYKDGPSDKEPFIPCSLTVAVEPGGRYKAGDGRVYQEPSAFVQFNRQGVARVSNPGHIATLRRLAVPGSGITEDYEEFMSKTLPSERQAARLKQQLAAATEETNRLKEQMQKQLAATPSDNVEAKRR